MNMRTWSNDSMIVLKFSGTHTYSQIMTLSSIVNIQMVTINYSHKVLLLDKINIYHGCNNQPTMRNANITPKFLGHYHDKNQRYICYWLEWTEYSELDKLIYIVSFVFKEKKLCFWMLPCKIEKYKHHIFKCNCCLELLLHTLNTLT